MIGPPLVEIWNLALNRIGQRQIGSPDDSSLMALACARSWPSARREVLREAAWGFATVIAELTEISDYDTPHDWGHAYAYPVKAVAIRKIFQPTEPLGAAGSVFLNQAPLTGPLPGAGYATPIRQTTGEKFREIFHPETNAKIILAYTADAIAEYTYDVEDTTLYDPSFVTLCGYRLAADIATPLTGDSSIAVNLIKIYNTRLSEAQRLNAIGDNTRSLGDSLTVDSR